MIAPPWSKPKTTQRRRLQLSRSSELPLLFVPITIAAVVHINPIALIPVTANTIGNMIQRGAGVVKGVPLLDLGVTNQRKT
jgi:hypothetical protein